jgi:serine/threonine-protein kinase
VGALRATVLPRIEHVEGEGRLVVAEKTRYEPIRALGAGGQAEVSLARDHDIDRVVAIKRLLPGRDDQGSVLRFVEEIRAVGQLEHPNIVPIHDVGVDERGQYFFVMKYVEGETLDSIIGKLRAGDEAVAPPDLHRDPARRAARARARHRAP